MKYQCIEILLDLNRSSNPGSGRDNSTDIVCCSKRRTSSKSSKRVFALVKPDSSKHLATTEIHSVEGCSDCKSLGMIASRFEISEEIEFAAASDLLLSTLFACAVEIKTEAVSIGLPVTENKVVDYLQYRGFCKVNSNCLDTDHVFFSIFDASDTFTTHLNRLAYDVLAGEYNERAISPGPSQESSESLASMLTSKLTRPIQRLLEVGPGSGDVLAELRKQTQEVIAVELSPKMAQLSKERVPDSLIIIANIMDLDFANNSFDGIYAGALLHLFSENNATKILRKFFCWIKDDGLIFLNTSVSTRSGSIIECKNDYNYQVPRFRSHWSETEFQRLIAESGLKIIDRVTTDEKERSKFWVGYVCSKEKRELSNVTSISG